MALIRSWGDTGEPLEALDYVPRDESWTSKLPQGTMISATGYGSSYWSQLGKISMQLAEDGRMERYFIKLSRTDLGRTMVEGEFESMQMLHRVKPDMVPRPIAYGTFHSDPDIHFFRCEFVDLHDQLPDVLDFCQSVAELHRKSMDFSPNNQFGFQVTTCNGTVRQYTAWHPSWEAFFIETLRDAFGLEELVHGKSERISQLLPAIYGNVCPRLLRPLETEGRVLRPCLVHGDLWDGNIAVRADSGRPFIFDASAVWAHNEYEFHIWRGARYRIGRTFLEEYFNHFPKSPPEDDWDDRNLLYSLIADLHSSILFPRTDRFRNLLIESMQLLVNKFPDGYTGSAHQRSSTIPDEKDEESAESTKVRTGHQ